MNLEVNRTENGATLQQFLAERLALSGNAAKRLIDQRRIFVNGRRIWMARHPLKAGDLVAGPPRLEKKPASKRPNMLYEDADYLVVDKPAGILSNGPALRLNSGQASLEQELMALTGNRALAACHRLDRDTSGCLLLAKHARAKERMIAVFAKNQIQKKYAAIARGRIAEKSFIVAKPIDGQSAVTRVSVLAANQAASHLAIAIETGRTHQIRKHLAAIGHPVLGDQQYGGGRAVPEIERGIARQMLHAAELKFIQPLTGRPVHCLASLPADFRECLKKYNLQ